MFDRPFSMRREVDRFFGAKLQIEHHFLHKSIVFVVVSANTRYFGCFHSELISACHHFESVIRSFMVVDIPIETLCRFRRWRIMILREKMTSPWTTLVYGSNVSLGSINLQALQPDTCHKGTIQRYHFFCCYHDFIFPRKYSQSMPFVCVCVWFPSFMAPKTISRCITEGAKAFTLCTYFAFISK